MSETVSPVKLSAHDTRLVSAAIVHTLAIIGAGALSGDFVNSLADSSPREYEMLGGARDMFARSKEGLDVGAPAPASSQTFLENLERLNAIGILLSTDQNAESEATLDEPVQVATDLDKDGREVGAKRYALWVTHDELHVLHWALKTGESIARKDPNFIPNGLKYAGIRKEVVGDAAFERFVTKFDNVHQQARIDNGEEAGVKSTPTPESTQ